MEKRGNYYCRSGNDQNIEVIAHFTPLYVYKIFRQPKGTVRDETFFSLHLSVDDVYKKIHKIY